MNIRLTQKRKQILDVLKQNHDALSAKEIYDTLPNIDLVTIYRNLDLFVQEKMIHELHLGGNETRYEYQKVPHHHAVCDTCQKVVHFTAPNKKLQKLLCLNDFEIDDIEVTVHGRCKNDR